MPWHGIGARQHCISLRMWRILPCCIMHHLSTNLIPAEHGCVPARSCATAAASSHCNLQGRALQCVSKVWCDSLSSTCLAEVRRVWRSLDARQVLHGLAAVRIALDAQARHQIDACARLLAKFVDCARADGHHPATGKLLVRARDPRRCGMCIGCVCFLHPLQARTWTAAALAGAFDRD